jgi:hypothetical protein
MYADSILLNTSSVDYTADSNTPTGAVSIGNVGSGSTSYAFNGLIDEVKVFNRKLTSDEVAISYYSGIEPHPADAEYLFNEGSGTVALDSSGNGNDGTITGATYTSDVPMKERTAVPTSGDPRLMRRAVGGNMVLNGDFEYAPPFVATQTADGWIDGTASGGGTGNIPTPIGWYLNINNNAAGSIQPDEKKNGSYALKLSTTGTGVSYVEAHHHSNTYYGYAGFDDTIPVLPSTSYTLSVWMKTRYVSGDSNDGAYVNVSQGDGDKNGITSNNTTKIKTTTDWTFYSITFTTNAATRFIGVQARIYGHTGAGTLIMDAWFDDIALKPTLPVTRALAGNRTLA